MDKEKLWKTILGEIQLNTSPATYKTFFLPSFIDNIDENSRIISIVCPNLMSKKIIESRYHGQILKAAEKFLEEKFELEFKVGIKTKNSNNQTLPLFSQQNVPGGSFSNLYPEYTFENFIVGPSNRLAHAVATAICENPGKAYNPFFLYSKVGLGKTHLVQSIGNYIAKHGGGKKVIYTTAESFTNELIETIQKGRRGRLTPTEFRKKYREVDVFIVDDVQFIAGRESTQEEFFHTFNALYLEKKQIILTSDRPPSEISKLEDRLSSRFASGMMADIQAPEFETRAAILKAKIEETDSNIPDDVVKFVALNVDSNIRELQGVLNQMIATSKALNQDPNIETIKDFLKNKITKKEPKDVSMSEIIRVTAKFYNLKTKDLTGISRLKNIALARQVCMFLIRDITNASYMAVGEMLGGRDHTTIMHGESKIKQMANSNQKIRKDIDGIKLNVGI